MAINIQQFRKKYPQYNDVNDIDLTRAIYNKLGPDTSFENFASKFMAEPEIDEDIRRMYGIRVPRDRPPSVLARMVPELPQTIGGEVGALAGAAVGGGPGAVVGAFIGGMGGKGYQQAVKMFRGTSDAPSSFGKVYAQQALAGLEEGGFEGGGRLVAKGLKRLAKPFAKSLIKEAPEMAALARKYGTHLTPGQLADSWIVDTTETIADASFFGGRRMKALKLIEQPAAVSKYADDIADMFTRQAGTSLDPDTIGRLVDDVIGGRNKSFMNQARALYGKVDELTQGTIENVAMKSERTSKILSASGEPLTEETTKMIQRRAGQAQVDISALKKFANEATEASAELEGIGASEAGEALLNKVKNLDDTISFKAAQELRSRLISEETAMAATKDKQHGIVKKLISLSDRAIDSGGKNLSPEALDAFRTANRFYKAGKERYSNRVVRNLIQTVEKKGEPEKIIPYIFQNKAVSRIKKTKAALGANSTAWQSLKAKYVEGLLTASPGQLTGANIPRSLQQMGEPALKEIFSNAELKAIRKLGDFSGTVSGKISPNLATGGSLVVQLVQGGAILAVIQGDLRTIGTPVFLGPEIISQLATRPSTAKWLTEGFDLSVRSPEAAALSARLLGAVRRAKKEKMNVAFPERPFGPHF